MTLDQRLGSRAPRLSSTVGIFLLIALAGFAALAASPQSRDNRPSTFADRTHRLELQMLELINADRAAPSSLRETSGRAQPLQWDARLAAVARAHSEEMAQRAYFSHEGWDGSLPSSRVSKAGIPWRSTGENIAKTSDVQEAESRFMNEPRFQHNHRANILSQNYTHVGIGIAKGSDGFLYITQEFADLR